MTPSGQDRSRRSPPAKPAPDPAALRRHAEQRLLQQQPAAGPARTEADLQRLVHELEVHQIELEMQNEELHQAREEREVALQKYADLYDFAPVGYVTLDRDGTILEANLASATLLGVDRSRLIRQRLGLHLTAADRPVLAGFLARVLASRTVDFCEVTILREGRPPAEVRIEAEADAAGGECRAVLEDITGHKQAETDRLILGKLESTGILAEGLSHDFNNLLTVIVLNLDLAETLGEPGGPQADVLAAAKRCALVASDLTKQLNSFARAGAPIRKPASLAGVIKNAVRPAAGGSRTHCELSLTDDLWLTEVDEGQIGEVIRSLVQNAKEATPPQGTVSIRAENVVLASHSNPPLPSGDYVRISIADHGGGITKAMRSKVFDPYFSTKPKGSQKGMGLGLAISQAVVRSHGGAIALEPETGAGATFHVHLPAARPRPPSTP